MAAAVAAPAAPLLGGMAAPAALPPRSRSLYVEDPAVSGLEGFMRNFLADYSPADYEPEAPEEENASEGGAAPQPARSYMARKVSEMCEESTTVLYVEYEHLQDANAVMADTIRDNYERADGVMRAALQAHVRAHHEDFLREAHGGDKQFFVGVTGLPTIDRLRDLRTEKIGRLVAFSGTVTRTSEVRPELFLGTFRCLECGTINAGVEQQYKFTPPVICCQDACNNKYVCFVFLCSCHFN